MTNILPTTNIPNVFDRSSASAQVGVRNVFDDETHVDLPQQTAVDPNDDTVAVPSPDTAAEAPDFANMLTEVLREQIQRMTISGTASGLSASDSSNSGVSSSGIDPAFSMSNLSSQGMEQMILASAAEGEATNSQMALLMVLMIMQSSGGGMGGGDSSGMMMQVLTALLQQLETESAPKFEPPDVTGISTQEVFQTWLPDSGETGFVKLPLAVWTAATPAITSSQEDRNPELYRAVLDQFRVETAPRYRPGRDGFTYCNIFVVDVTRAMGVHLQQMGATAMCNWLGTTGKEHGWREVDAETAQRYANEGKPAVTSAGSIGHVQMVAPSRDGKYDPELGVAIAQAGRIVSNYTHITKIYSGNSMKQVRYFVND